MTELAAFLVVALSFGLLYAGAQLLHRAALRQRAARLQLLARETKLTQTEHGLSGRVQGVEVSVNPTEGNPPLYEINYGFHRLSMNGAFLARRVGCRWAATWAWDTQAQDLGHPLLDGRAVFQIDGLAFVHRVFQEPDVARLAAKLLEHPSVGLFGVDRREVFFVLVNKLGDDAAAVLEDGLALCQRLTAVSPVNDRALGSLGATSAGGSAVGVPSLVSRDKK